MPIYNFTVRNALERDRAEALSIMQAAWENAYAHIYSADLMAKIFSDHLPQRAAWTAERSEKLATLLAEQTGSRIVGMASIALCKNGDGELTHLYVRPSSQGQGVGLALWNEAIKLLKQRGCAALRVWVLERADAVSFYANRAVFVDEGIYYIGTQAEKARCYRLVF